MSLLLRAATGAVFMAAAHAAASEPASPWTRVDFELACVGCSPAMQAIPLTGSFSYQSSLTGVIGLADLRSFNVSLLVTDNSVPVSVNPTQGGSFDLAAMRGFETAVSSNPLSGFMHFAWDATNRKFVEGYAGPGWSNEGSQTLHWLAGVNSTPALDGFRVDRLPAAGSGLSQSVTLFTAAPGDVATGRSFIQEFNAWSVTVTAVPEPSAYALGAAGLGLLMWLARGRRRTQRGEAVTALA